MGVCSRPSRQIAGGPRMTNLCLRKRRDEKEAVISKLESNVVKFFRGIVVQNTTSPQENLIQIYREAKVTKFQKGEETSGLDTWTVLSFVRSLGREIVFSFHILWSKMRKAAKLRQEKLLRKWRKENLKIFVMCRETNFCQDSSRCYEKLNSRKAKPIKTANFRTNSTKKPQWVDGKKQPQKFVSSHNTEHRRSSWDIFPQKVQIARSTATPEDKCAVTGKHLLLLNF